MRLINTSSFVIEKFHDLSIAPPYAILSHTWSNDNELEFKDLCGPDAAQRASRDFKISHTCRLARDSGLPYAWIDTICIDQSSSSDKSEAIVAMFRYYQQAKICFVFMADVEGNGILPTTERPEAIRYWAESSHHANVPEEMVQFWKFWRARWFTRGWTLQELIAPTNMTFYDKNWNELGSLKILSEIIEEKTGIDSAVLGNIQALRGCSIAKRMSWAAGRETRRPEDVAYSLMGIFDVGMPVIYGEGGERAFIRLQGEIIKISDDQSLFAWPLAADPINCGLLARSPTAFAHSKKITQVRFRRPSPPYFIANNGISITLNLTPWATDVYLANINCFLQRDDPYDHRRTDPLLLGIFLKRQMEDGKYIRVAYQGKDLYEDNSARVANLRLTTSGSYIGGSRTSSLVSRMVSVTAPQTVLQEDLKTTFNGFWLGTDMLKPFPTMETQSQYYWNENLQTIHFASNQLEYSAGLTIWSRDRTKESGYIMTIGFDFDFNPICYVYGPDQHNHRFDDKIMLSSPVSEPEWSWTQWSWEYGAVDLTNQQEKEKVCRLKGDRWHGLSVLLFCEQQRKLRLKFEKVSREDRLVWRFNVADYGVPDDVAVTS